MNYSSNQPLLVCDASIESDVNRSKSVKKINEGQTLRDLLVIDESDHDEDGSGADAASPTMIRRHSLTFDNSKELTPHLGDKVDNFGD